MRPVVLLLVMMISAGPVSSAVIEKQSLGAGSPDLIVVAGELVAGDEDKFRTVASTTQKAIVAFTGPGGSIVAALTIGEQIRLRSFDTVVLGRDMCASACALAWLGGARRFMAEEARIGFHAAWDARSGEVSGFANALVGAYLNKIGLSPQAIMYVTVAAPSSMTWLKAESAQTYGIEMSVLSNEEQQASPPATVSRGLTQSPLEDAAIAFMYQHAAAQSAADSVAVGRVRGHYDETVFYYGKHLTKAAVLQEYQAFVERWPTRTYRLRPESVQVQCFPNSQVCNVNANFSWVAVSAARGKRSQGESSWSLGLLRREGAFVITSVNGAVLKRRISDLNDDSVATQQ
jgi:hypothetical protein